MKTGRLLAFIVIAGSLGYSLSLLRPVAAEKVAWEMRAPAPMPRTEVSAAVVDGKIYLLGGLTKEGVTSRVEMYDPATDRWEKKAPLPTPRDHLAVAVVNGKIHAIGGRFNSDYSENLALHHIYDPAENRWGEAAPLLKPRSGIAAAVLNGKIYLFGGEAPQGTFADNDVYDPGQNQWQSAPPMPTPRHGLGAATIGNQIFVIAGGPRPGGSVSSTNEVFRME